MRKKCGIAQWGTFSIFKKQKKKILPQKELDYMWPLISGLGRFNVQAYAIAIDNGDLNSESITAIEKEMLKCFIEDAKNYNPSE